MEDGSHLIQFEQNRFTQKKTIRVDGADVKQKYQFLDLGVTDPFPIGAHMGCVVTQRKGRKVEFDLAVDGRSITTEQLVVLPLPMPGWAWIFVVACCLIPVVSMGGALAAVIGFGGAAICARTARESKYSQGARIMISVGATVLSWVLFLVVVGAVWAMMQPA